MRNKKYLKETAARNAVLQKAHDICEPAFHAFDFPEYYDIQEKTEEDVMDDFMYIENYQQKEPYKQWVKLRVLFHKIFEGYRICTHCADGLTAAAMPEYAKEYDEKIFAGYSYNTCCADCLESHSSCDVCRNPIDAGRYVPEPHGILEEVIYWIQNEDIRDQFNLAHAYTYLYCFNEMWDIYDEDDMKLILKLARAVIRKAEKAGFDGKDFIKWERELPDYAEIVKKAMAKIEGGAIDFNTLPEGAKLNHADFGECLFKSVNDLGVIVTLNNGVDFLEDLTGKLSNVNS